MLQNHLARSSQAPLLMVACVCTGCIAIAPRGIPPGKAVAREDPSDAVEALVEAHNLERGRRGLPPLAVNESLSAAAQKHAEEMAARGRMSHRGFDGSSPFRRMERAGYSYVRAGENVAYGQPTVADVMAVWMRSPGHKRNVLGKFSEIGVGRATDEGGTPYWCVTFGSPRGMESASRVEGVM